MTYQDQQDGVSEYTASVYTMRAQFHVDTIVVVDPVHILLNVANRPIIKDLGW